MGFLAEMVQATRASLDDPAYHEGIPASRPSGRTSLRAAVERDRMRGGLLAEFKRRSPGAAAPVLPPRTPAGFVQSLSRAGVAAYSCLASIPRFNGRPADVAAVVGSTDRPVLFKDFIIDPAQIDTAARCGASAVLLIARLETEGLLKTPLASLADRAHSLGLEVLLEWHARTELRPTVDVSADVYGVNVRDLDTLEMRPDVAAETLEAALGHRPLLGLSGVEGPEQARRFWDQHVDGILVGTALARAPDPVAFLASLRRSPSIGDR
ncbi:MAG TPA: indole-3-glycerol-phosphate synthase [Thermoplasmata archaeon]|nr:indole-3-glycerol-phosphate synthase [Thermoplasmata archaeon]